MADSPNSSTFSISPWWALLLLPALLGIGWLVGTMPVPPAPATQGGPGSPNKPATATLSNWMSYDDAVAESGRTGKPVFIDFSAEWCGPCQRLKREVFEEADSWDALRAAAIPVSIVDRRREDGSNASQTDDLQRRYSVDAFPTLIVFSPRSGRVQRAQGFGDANRTVAWVRESSNSVR
jgi:thiol:disulfide interchange protein